MPMPVRDVGRALRVLRSNVEGVPSILQRVLDSLVVCVFCLELQVIIAVGVWLAVVLYKGLIN